MDGGGAVGTAGGACVTVGWEAPDRRVHSHVCYCCVSAQSMEDFMVHLFEDCNLCAIHAKRVTISAC